jgi:hypothetical protein
MDTGPKRAATRHATARGAIGLKPSTASVVEHRMPLNGGAISYTKAGTGPVVLLVHGLRGTRRTWQHSIPGWRAPTRCSRPIFPATACPTRPGMPFPPILR